MITIEAQSFRIHDLKTLIGYAYTNCYFSLEFGVEREGEHVYFAFLRSNR